MALNHKEGLVCVQKYSPESPFLIGGLKGDGGGLDLVTTEIYSNIYESLSITVKLHLY